MFLHPQPLRLRRVGEECRRGRRERGEPGPLKSSRSKKKMKVSKATVTFLPTSCFLTNFRFIKGYMNRGQATTTDNSEYLAFVRQNYLNKLKDNLPKTVLDKTTWLPPPAVLTEVEQ